MNMVLIVIIICMTIIVLKMIEGDWYEIDMKLKEFVDLYYGNFNVRRKYDTEYLLIKVNHEIYEAHVFREFDELEIKLINNRDNNITIII